MSDEREQAAGQVSAQKSSAETVESGKPAAILPREIGGPQGPEPTRFGDWERGGRCIDF